ncbi:MAG: DUF459 domain-containing protein [Akkermansia sp.]|nr:DUF459 domain-containing protein [Akkermansia sp.]
MPHSLKICLGTLLAAVLIGLQNIDEYAQQLEMKAPQLSGLAEDLRQICRCTGLPQWFNIQKNFYNSWGESAQQEPAIPEAPPAEPIPQPEIVPAPQPLVTPAPPVEVKTKPVARKKRVSKKKRVGAKKTAKKKNRKKPVARKKITKKSVRKKAKPRVRKKPVRKLARIRSESAPGVVLKVKSNKKEVLLKRRPMPRTSEWPAPLPELNMEPQAVAAANLAAPVHYRIMLMGDSLMEDLGPATYRVLRSRKGLHFILTAKFSTGLCRPDYFNWPQNLEPAVKEHRPDIIIIFIGANDGMPIKVEDKNISPYSRDAWRDAYRGKMQEIFDIARKYECRVLWVGLPPMGGKYAALLKNTADTQQAVCESLHVPYLDTVPLLGDENGAYRTYMTNERGQTVRLRKKDLEHLAPAGNELIVRSMLPHIEHVIYDFRTKHPEKCLTPEEIKQRGNARMDVTIKYIPHRRK